MAQPVPGHVETLRMRFDAFELNEADARLTHDGQPVSLQPRAFGVISELQPDVAMFGRCVEHFGTSEPYLPCMTS